MKIAFLFDGDNAVFGTPWIGYFAKKGHETHWISLPHITDIVPSSVQTHSLGTYPSNPVAAWRAARRVRRILDRIRPDLLHVHSVGTYGLVATLTRFQPLVATAWGSDVLIAGQRPLIRPLVKRALDTSRLITCDAEHMRTAMVAMGVPHDKIHIIHFGTDTDVFRPRGGNPVLRRRLGLEGRPVVTSFRSLRPLYDVGTLVRAIPDVVRSVPDVVFVIAGGGEERDTLETLTHTLGVSDNVMFTGFLTYDAIPEYQAMADVYVSTALSDAGLAASTSEAMASGVPAIVSDVAANRLWVEDGKGGYIVPARDSAALGARIVTLLRAPALRRAFGAHNRSVIETRNSYLVEMGKMERLYEGTVEQFRRA